MYTSLVAQLVKNLPALRETWVQSLGWEDPLEEGMVTHSSILAWRIPQTEEAIALFRWFNQDEMVFPLLVFNLHCLGKLELKFKLISTVYVKQRLFLPFEH